MMIDLADLKRSPYNVLYQIEQFLNINHEITEDSVSYRRGDCFCGVSPFKNHIGSCMMMECDDIIEIPKEIITLLKDYYKEDNAILFNLLGEDFGWNNLSERYKWNKTFIV